MDALLDAGSMGEVYRARDTRLERLEREVAIEVLPAGVSADPDRLVRVEREAHAAALNHPNIWRSSISARTTAHRSSSRNCWQGEMLRQLCAAGPLPPRRALEYAVSIACALAAAQIKGIVHRDLKPENVFVTLHVALAYT